MVLTNIKKFNFFYQTETASNTKLTPLLYKQLIAGWTIPEDVTDA